MDEQQLAARFEDYSTEDQLILLLRELTDTPKLPGSHFEELVARIYSMTSWSPFHSDLLGRYQIRHGQEAIVENLMNSLINSPGHLVLDIGANKGEFSRRAEQNPNVDEVIAFEPVEELAQQLRDSLHPQSKITVESLAIGNKRCQSRINVVAGESGLSSLLPFNDEYHYFHSAFDQSAVQQATQVTTLDEYLAEELATKNSRPIALKVDTQGFELQVLQGAEALFASQRVRAVMVEVMTVPKYEGSATYTEIFDFLNSRSFELFDLLPFYREIGQEFQGAPLGRLTEFDCLFSHKSFSPTVDPT